MKKSKLIGFECPSVRLKGQTSLNRNYKTTKVNKAELDAIEETRKKDERDYQNMIMYQTNMEKYKKNNADYVFNENQEKMMEQKRLEDIELAKLKYKNYKFEYIDIECIIIFCLIDNILTKICYIHHNFL